jgi:hypothetical protein
VRLIGINLDFVVGTDRHNTDKFLSGASLSGNS